MLPSSLLPMRPSPVRQSIAHFGDGRKRARPGCGALDGVERRREDQVDRVALENAASVATLLLTSDCIITEAPKDEEDHAGGGHDHHGGMGGGHGEGGRVRRRHRA